MTAVGVLGGSFDPVHRGHVALAAAARNALGLEHVWLLPCGDPPHKPDRSLAARYHRLEMLYLAVEGRPGLGVSTFEIARQGICFTIDTLRALRSADPHHGWVFVCGSDALADVVTWREHHALLAEFDFAAMIRPEDGGGPRPTAWPTIVERRVAAWPAPDGLAPGAGGRIFRVESPALAVSSSLVRARAAAGGPLDDLVATRVAGYIQRHRLYREEAAR